MHILIDARRHGMFRPISDKMHGATELLIKYSARVLTELGHRVDVLANEKEGQYVDGVYWWPSQSAMLNGPQTCDVFIASDQLYTLPQFKRRAAILMLTFSEPPTHGSEKQIARVLCFSDMHKSLLLRNRPNFTEEQVVIFPPAVDTEAYNPPMQKIRGRLIWCNSPDRGLIHLKHMWPALKAKVPDISLMVTYNFDWFFDRAKWLHSHIALDTWELAKWLEEEPSVIKAPALNRQELVKQQLQAQLFAYPSDPPGVEGMIHCISALECMAAGCLVILPKLDAFPEVFEGAAHFTDHPINYDEWVAVIVDALEHPDKYSNLRQQGYALAGRHSLVAYKSQWEKVLQEVMACVPS